MVVPVVRNPDGTSVEVAPVHKIPLTLGQPTVFRLTRAIRQAREFSEGEKSADTVPWDGDRGRWWQHHLMLVVIRWEEGQVQFFEPEPGEVETEHLPEDISDSDLAERLVQRLGHKLHGG